MFFFYQRISKLFAHIYLSSLSSGLLFAIWRQLEVIYHLLYLLGPRHRSHIYSARPLEPKDEYSLGSCSESSHSMLGEWSPFPASNH